MGFFRQLKAYTFFKDGHVQDIEMEIVSKECSYSFVRAKVLPSMRTDVVYKTWVVIAKSTGFIHSADCDCTAGLGEACNHIAALLFALEHFCRTNKNKVSCTSMPCTWNKPRKRKLSPKKIEDITPVKHVHGKVPRKVAVPKDGEYTPSSNVDESFLESFLGSLGSVNPHAAILTVYQPRTLFIQSENDISGDLNLSNFEERESEEVDFDSNVKAYSPSPLHSGQHSNTLNGGSNVNEEIQHYFDSMVIDQHEAELIEACSRGQNENPKWKLVRKGRLTASIMGTVCKRRETTAPDRLVSLILQNEPDKCLDNIPEIKWGRDHEQTARESYINYMKSHGHQNVTVFERGLVVNVKYPHMGASPDGYVYCPSCKPYQGMLEIKCPYKWRQGTIEKALENSEFYCFRASNGSIKLKENSNYFYQVQGQMAICKRKWCDFVIWTEKDLCIERIAFNETFWSSTMLPKLNKFYLEALIPEVLHITKTKEF